MPRTSLLIALAAILAGLGAAPVSGAGEEGPRQEAFVFKTVGERELRVHMHFPPGWKAEDRRPVMVFFFGGGWTNGSVRAFSRQADYFARRGLVTARADYRIKSRDGVTPDVCVEDARSAIRWLRTNAGRLGVDPARLITSGGSAGGHLAACAMIEESAECAEDDLTVSTIPAAMVLFNPVLDFTGGQLIRRLGGDEELAALISPTLHLKAGAPPALILFGSEDRLIAHGEAYWEKAEELGVRADRYVAPGEGHSFFNRSPELERTLLAADRFLASLGLLEGEPTIEVPEVTRQAPRDRGRRRTGRFFEQRDRDGDGRLSIEEFPERWRRAFAGIDRDGDGFVTPEEAASSRAAAGRRPGRAGRADRGERPRGPAPDVAGVRYGAHRANVLDLWLAESEEPTPLVIYYHGGGFRGGDKRSLDPTLLAKLLENGVSVAAVNYRLSGEAPFPAQMHDCARALQFLRRNAGLHNLDPARVGATGGSAGAGISLWLAFHDDLAEPESEDAVARQSTRISVAVVYAAQSSYDPRFIRELFDTEEVDGALIPFFGMKDASDVDDPRFHPLFEEASPIHHATAGDAPVMLFYPQANETLEPGSPGRRHIHHPKFGLVLKEKLDALGVECVVLLREDHPRGAPVDEYVRFFLAKLGR